MPSTIAVPTRTSARSGPGLRSRPDPHQGRLSDPTPTPDPRPELPPSTRAVLTLCTELGLTIAVRPGSGGRLLCLAGHLDEGPFGLLALDRTGRVIGMQLFDGLEDPRLSPDPLLRRQARSKSFAATLAALHRSREAGEPAVSGESHVDEPRGCRHAS